jgi:hypothetical protein
VQTLQDKVDQMRGAKERRGGVSEKEQSVLEEAEKKLTKYRKVVNIMRTALGTTVQKLVEGRFGKMDEVFVRVMEAQMEFFQAGMERTATFKASVENYRRRFPKGSSGAEAMEGNGRARGASSERDSDSDSDDGRGPGSAETEDLDAFYSDLSPDAAPPKVTSPVAVEAKKRLSANSGNGDFLDMFSQGASASVAVPSPRAAASSSGGSGDFLDMFSTGSSRGGGGGGLPSSMSQDLFDMSGMATPSSLPDSGSTTPMRFDNFDPFGSSANTSSGRVPPDTSKYSNTSSSMGGFGAFGDMLGSSSRATGSAGSSDAVEEFRERERQQQSEAAAKDDAKKGLEGKLLAWEYKGQVRKDIRTLLSTLHTITWEGNRWKQVGLPDLLDAKKVQYSLFTRPTAPLSLFDSFYSMVH